MFLRIYMMYIRINIYYFLKGSSMDLIESKSYHSSSSFQGDEIPSLLTIVQDEIETVIHLNLMNT
jgi:hypothetical protein